MSENISENWWGSYKDRFPDGLSIHIDLNEYQTCGIKDLHITVNDKEFLFSREEIFEILNKLKQGRLR